MACGEGQVGGRAAGTQGRERLKARVGSKVVREQKTQGWPVRKLVAGVTTSRTAGVSGEWLDHSGPLDKIPLHRQFRF